MRNSKWPPFGFIKFYFYLHLDLELTQVVLGPELVLVHPPPPPHTSHFDQGTSVNDINDLSRDFSKLPQGKSNLHNISSYN